MAVRIFDRASIDCLIARSFLQISMARTIVAARADPRACPPRVGSAKPADFDPKPGQFSGKNIRSVS